MSNPLQIDGEQLIQLQQATGLSEREMAAAMGVNFNSMHGMMSVSYTHLTLPTTPYV